MLEFVTDAVTLCMAYVRAHVGASVIVSKFSDRLNDARGKESIRALSVRAAKLGNVGESTLHPYFRAEHPRPTMQVVVALSKALKIPTDELRELAGLPSEGQPWTPPVESRLMNDRQRRAVAELIRSFAQTLGAEHVVETASKSDAQETVNQNEETRGSSDNVQSSADRLGAAVDTGRPKLKVKDLPKNA